jgi:hypothetical protein
MDLGSGGPLTLPGSSYVLGGGKTGIVYSFDTAHGGLSHWENNGNPVAPAPYWFQATDLTYSLHHIHGSPVFVGTDASHPGTGRLYVWGESNQARLFTLTNGQKTGGSTDSWPALSDTQTAAGGMPGGMLSYAGNGPNGGVLWGTHTASTGDTNLHAGSNGSWQPGVLWAFDADTMQQLWSSTESWRFGKFAPPTIANGRVYVATFSGEVAVYGLR